MYDGEKYPTAEHAFQAAKCINKNDRERIRDAKNPSIAKRLGRSVHLRSDWELEKVNIMENILKIKFHEKKLRDSLVDTKDSKLIEQNEWHDMYWGVCTCAKHMQYGKNMMGELLMKIRNEI